MYLIKQKISLNIDKKLLERVDKEANIHFKWFYNRLQRSKMIEYMLRSYLVNEKNKNS